MLYTAIEFINPTGETGEIIIAMLSDMQYEGFEETGASLKAFIPSSLFDKDQLDEVAARLQLSYTVTQIPDINWNKEWEANFQPVIIEGFCAIRAEFHEPVQDVQHEIIITPKMSFGTGHHVTTYMMLQQMREMDFKNKHVMDFGTGTGVLAILAHRMGAAPVTAIDNDSYSIENASENIKRNGAGSIELIMADHPVANHACDIILSNITRNVIVQNFSLFHTYLAPGGIIVLSGFLFDDENETLAVASGFGFAMDKKLQEGNWICLKLIKS